MTAKLSFTILVLYCLSLVGSVFLSLFGIGCQEIFFDNESSFLVYFVGSMVTYAYCLLQLSISECDMLPKDPCQKIRFGISW